MPGKARNFSEMGISVRVAAELKGVSCKTIYNWIAAGKISARKVSGRYWIKEDERFQEAARYRRLPQDNLIAQNRKLQRENRRLQRDVADRQAAIAIAVEIESEKLREENRVLREKFQTQYQRLYEAYQLLKRQSSCNEQQWRYHGDGVHQQLEEHKRFNQRLQQELEAAKKIYKHLCYEHQAALAEIEDLKDELAKWKIVDAWEGTSQTVELSLSPKQIGTTSPKQIETTSVLDTLSHWEVMEE